MKKCGGIEEFLTASLLHLRPLLITSREPGVFHQIVQQHANIFILLQLNHAMIDEQTIIQLTKQPGTLSLATWIVNPKHFSQIP